ncbi:AAA family ATPase [Roseibium aggregatum]|uniref:AAA family ATPase n=1 Tax=Roseibium aggregatum TaxID=187304 RepID=UPI003A97B4D1
MTPEDRLAIHLFGVFEARAHGIPLRLPTRRVELVLALLALSPGKAISRSYLSTLLWPGQESSLARASLRQALFRLRGALGTQHAAALETEAGWVKLRREAVVLDIDAIDVEGAGPTEAPDGLPLDGLSGFEPEIEEVIDAARADLRRRLCAWHAAAATRALAERRFVDLEGHGRRRLVLEPYDEAALRDLMTALWRQGRRNAALLAFQQASQRIRDDLSVAVEPETTELFQNIRASRDPREESNKAETAGKDNPAAAQGDPPAPPFAERVKSTEEEAGLAHLRYLAVIHLASERLRASMIDSDPENAEAASNRAIRAIEVVIEREGGKIVGRAGHQLSAVFGAHRPDESPALSAALAGFEIAGQDCAVGIHAGAGLVGSQSEAFPLALRAQSLSAMAKPGEVRVTGEVEASCRGAFEFIPAEALPEESGIPAVATWRLRRETSVRSGFDIRKARGLGRFCGRHQELAALTDVTAQSGPRIAAVIGTAGIGKSRLVHEFLKQRPPGMLLRVQFARGEMGGSVACFSNMVRYLLDIDPDQPEPGIEAALPPELATDELKEWLVPALAGVLGQVELEKPWLALPRHQRFQVLADALLTIIGALGGRDCVLLIEDMHWADEQAAALIERLVRSLDAAGPMLVITRRPASAESWFGHEHVRTLTLQPLGRDDAVALLADTGLPSWIRATVLERCEGVPLFLEEFSRAAISENTDPKDVANTHPGSQPFGFLPPGLLGILSYRIDALSDPARQTLEAAAVLGAEPTDTFLTMLCGLRREAYDVAISELADADLLYRIRMFPKRSYAFKHALIQDAAYQGIPASRRTALHARVVRAHEELGREGDTDDAALAFHALNGNLLEQAVEFAMRAARDAAARSSYAQANRMTDIALQAIAGLPSSERLLRLEADILSWRRALLWPLGQMNRTIDGLERAETIARDLGDDHKLAEVCIHRAYMHSGDGKPWLGLDFCTKATAAASRIGEKRLLAEAALARCQIHSLQGKMRAALEAIHDHAGAWDDRRHALDGLLVTRYVMMNFLVARAHAALGDGDAGWEHIRRAAKIAMETNRPADRYITCRGLTDIGAFCRNPEMALRACSTSLEIARRADMPAYVAWAEAEMAELKLTSGEHEEGMADLQTLLDQDSDMLLRIARIKAKTALVCSVPESGNRSVQRLQDVLQEAETADLPLLRVRLLREIAEQLKATDPVNAASLGNAADEIEAAEGYAVAKAPDASSFDAFLAALGDF